MFSKQLGIEEIKCKHAGKVAIDVKQIAAHAQKILGHPVMFHHRLGSDRYISFFISNHSISSVSLDIFSYGEKDAFSYQTSIKIPCCQEDLQMFAAILKYIKNRCAEAYCSQSMFDECSSSPGAYPIDLNATKMVKWEQLMKVFFKSILTNPSYTYSVDNGKIRFVFGANRFVAGTDYNQIKNNLIPAIQKHIWQQPFSSVDDTRLFATVVKQNGFETRQSHSFFHWNNKTSITFGYGDYLLLKYQEQWKAIKPKIWKPILSPYFYKYDDFNENLLLPMPISEYETLKEILWNKSSHLEISLSVEGEDRRLRVTCV